MKTIALAHTNKPVVIKTNENILRALLVEQIPVVMACGGKGLCATCHVHVERGADGLSPRNKKEERTLGLLAEADATSRLACQAHVLKDGVVVRLPKGLYIERSSDLKDLIGRRAEARLLHPVDGRVMVEEGKIITRSIVEKLQQVDIDLQRILAQTRQA
ncbi:MAG: (2Fe-2S)-binding protein [Polyangiaceae bacterium]|jgi:ferredoxin|nr:(2Fe-2S)-binding protein [Polyangiaceae bacterium]